MQPNCIYQSEASLKPVWSQSGASLKPVGCKFNFGVNEPLDKWIPTGFNSSTEIIVTAAKQLIKIKVVFSHTLLHFSKKANKKSRTYGTSDWLRQVTWFLEADPSDPLPGAD